MNEKKTCCFFGHRRITEAENMYIKIYETMENLILNNNVDTFLMGSKSDFDSLCRKAVSELKEKYPYIKRIYVRAEYEYINNSYEEYLLESCEETYYPDRIKNAGKAVYIERNYEMIDKSDYCIVYYKTGYSPPERKTAKNDLLYYQPKSGTAIAYQYAVKRKKEIINIGEEDLLF